jgi:7-keto-8-aminopelargonate synthetase-like enzyme
VARGRLSAHRRWLEDELRNRGWPLVSSHTGMVVVDVRDREQLATVVQRLQGKRVVANVVTFPAIPSGSYRIRLCMSAEHRSGDIELAAEALGSPPGSKVKHLPGVSATPDGELVRT